MFICSFLTLLSRVYCRKVVTEEDSCFDGNFFITCSSLLPNFEQQRACSPSTFSYCYLAYLFVEFRNDCEFLCLSNKLEILSICAHRYFRHKLKHFFLEIERLPRKTMRCTVASSRAGDTTGRHSSCESMSHITR